MVVVFDEVLDTLLVDFSCLFSTALRCQGGIPRPSPVMPQLSQELSLSQDFEFTYPYRSGNFKLLVRLDVRLDR